MSDLEYRMIGDDFMMPVQAAVAVFERYLRLWKETQEQFPEAIVPLSPDRIMESVTYLKEKGDIPS